MQHLIKAGSWSACGSSPSSSSVHQQALPRTSLASISSTSSGISSFSGGRLTCSPCEKWQLTPPYEKRKDGTKWRWKKGNCRAALPDDAPFALAIGASILSTLIIPASTDVEENKEESLFGPDDVLSGAMQIISFIPLFNWLVWVFAWLDSRQSRYLVFVIVYLAPYLKTGLSLSPEESWLPIASVLACIAHVQLDISVNAEGSEPPLGNLSRSLLEKAQVKDLQSRTGGLVTRLKTLAEKSDGRPIETALQEDDQRQEAEWKAIQEEAQKNEFAEWDEKLSRAVEEPVKEVDA